MPNAHQHLDLDQYVANDAGTAGFWGNMRSYMVSLLKAYWGANATEANDYCFDYLPRLAGDHGTYATVANQLDGTCKGYFLVGENPAIGSANGKFQRLGMANLDWLVVRDLQLIESATFWKDGPEIETGELRTEEIATEVFFLPAAAHTEKDGSFTNTQRLLQWHHKAVEPPGDARSDLWFHYHLGRMIRSKLAGSTDPRDRPLLELTWSYPAYGETEEPSAESVLAEINGHGPEGPLSAYTELKDDGSTACGCWIYCGVYAGGKNQAANRKPGSEQDWVASGWAWAWPANRRILYNRASADPEGKPWSERKKLLTWDPVQRKWVGPDVPDFELTKPPDYHPPEGAKAQEAIGGADPFIMQTDGQGLAVRSGRPRGRTAARALRAVRIAGGQPALPSAGEPGTAGARQSAQSLQPGPQ
jgi:formate dehydrogenase major subunit